jgi:hypothetical protein
MRGKAFFVGVGMYALVLLGVGATQPHSPCQTVDSLPKRFIRYHNRVNIWIRVGDIEYRCRAHMASDAYIQLERRCVPDESLVGGVIIPPSHPISLCITATSPDPIRPDVVWLHTEPHGGFMITDGNFTLHPGIPVW